MPIPLSAEHLMQHVRALADEIGPRPTGHPGADQARTYIHGQLTTQGEKPGNISTKFSTGTHPQKMGEKASRYP